jgi:transposase
MVLENGPRRRDELSPRQVAKRTGAHVRTVRRWCRSAENGERSPLTGAVRKDATGHFWISRAVVGE